jgi:DNA-binding transcriptional ArsR family regulator
MNTLPNIAQVGALIGDPVRAAMLGALMDGSERPAGELASMSGIAPQTASSHLTRLLDGGLLAARRHGRYRYYRLRDSEVAHAVETLSVAADIAPRRRRGIDPALKRARRCYDHIAGELGVAICDALVADKRVIAGGDGYVLSAAGSVWLDSLGLAPAADNRRPIVRSCLDWSERRSHLAGWLGTAILTEMERCRAVSRSFETRSLKVTGKGSAIFKRHFGLDWPSN